jgi:hypothetical protein
VCRIEKFLYNAEPRRAKQTGGAAYLESKMIILWTRKEREQYFRGIHKNNDEKNKQKVPVVDVASRAARCVRSKV